MLLPVCFIACCRLISTITTRGGDSDAFKAAGQRVKAVTAGRNQAEKRTRTATGKETFPNQSHGVMQEETGRGV